MKITYVSKTFPSTRPFLDGVLIAIIAGLQYINRNYDDYELRGVMGEWTREEARAEIQAGIDCQEHNRVSGEFWSGG